MKTFWKLFFSISLSVLLSSSIGGSLLIYSSFHSSLERERETAQNENELIFQMLKMKLTREQERILLDDDGLLETTIRKVAETLPNQAGIEGIQFSVSEQNGVTVYTSPYFQIECASAVIPEKGEYVSLISRKDRVYFLTGMCRMEFGEGETYIIQNQRNVTDIYLEKERLYGYFRWITLVMIVICYAVVFLISYRFMRPIEEARKRQQRFTDNFAHELKTPLTSMIGYADMIRSKKMPDEQMILYADQIVREGKRMEAMSMKLMDLIVLRKQDFKRYNVSAEFFLSGVAETVSLLLKRENVEFQIMAEDALIKIEPDLMKTVVINLIDNGRKAVANGGIIKLTGKLCGNTYQIIVQDNGCGMEPKELHKVTEAFYMVDKSRGRSDGGAGLGLAICKNIVQMHKGKMTIKSKPGMGTIVTVQIGGEQIED